ncbi:MAG: DUF1624 domain-containing protein [Planctomycetales bacterium]|nr:DUF1624 domain-containing protein [Planctomycetales bacterium]
MSTNDPAHSRLLSLDAFRGLTILAMILVNNPGTWSSLYWPVAHAKWHGWTPTDLVFPWFLFIVGAAMAFSQRKFRDGLWNSIAIRRIARRTLALLALGLTLNASGSLLRPLVGESLTLDVSQLRLPGVLQRIALAYLFASCITLALRPRWQLVLACVLLFGYAGTLTYLPNPSETTSNLSPTDNVVRRIDLAILGADHMYTHATSEPTDPEGLLSTLPAIVTTLIGYAAGTFLRDAPRNYGTAGKLAAAGAACFVVGWLWDRLGLPINKKLWTSSFVLATGGLACVGLAMSFALFDVVRRPRLALPLQLVGVNAIFLFVASGLTSRLLSMVEVAQGTESTSLQRWLYATLCDSWISPPEASSLAYAMLTMAFWWLVAAGLWRRGWAWRV